MNFSKALEKLKEGYKLTRNGWNGNGMFVYYVPPNVYGTTTDVGKKEFGVAVKYEAYFAMRTVKGTVSTWVPSVGDCLAEDWQIVI